MPLALLTRLHAGVLLIPLLTPSSASADWFITPFLGLKFAGAIEPNRLDLETGAGNAKVTLGVAAGGLSDAVLGIEAELGYSPRFFEQSGASDLIARSNVTTLMGSVIVAVPRWITRDALRPYAIGGVGLVHVGIDDVAGIIPVKSNLFGMNIGGGAIGRLTNRTSMRFDVRHIRTLAGARDGLFNVTRLSYWRATVGISLQGLF